MIPRELNDIADTFFVSATLLLPHKNFKGNIYEIQLVYWPSILDNCEHWKVFNDDNQIIKFLETKEGFDEMYFEGGEYDPNEVLSKVDLEISHEVIQLKGKKFTKGGFFGKFVW